MDNSRSRFFEKPSHDSILSEAKQKSFTNELVHKFCWNLILFILVSLIITSNESFAASNLLSDVKQVSVGYKHVCAINSEDKLYCWGWNAQGQLGDGTTTDGMTPKFVGDYGLLGGAGVKSVSAGSNHTCAINNDNKLYCWGWNGQGELGNGTTTQNSRPSLVNGTGLLDGLGVKSVSAGSMHTCAINNDNKLYCWGYNYYGQLGNGTKTDSLTPILVNGNGLLGNLKILSVSAYHNTCAINSANQLYCWGWGGGDKADTIPVLVNDDGLLGGYGVIGIAGSCAINSDSKLYCREGDDESGDFSLFNNDGLLGGYGVNNVSGNCAVNSENELYCWGNNEYGRLGDGTIVDSATPIPVNSDGLLGGKGVKSVSSNSNFTCAISNENKLFCWGNIESWNPAIPDKIKTPMPVFDSSQEARTGTVAGENIDNIIAGSSYTCVVSDDPNSAKDKPQEIYNALKEELKI